MAKLNPEGNALVYSTYIGGSGEDSANAIAVDDAGNVYLTGETLSSDFPVTAGAYQNKRNGNSIFDNDIFALKLNASGSGLLYSTYIGGKGGELSSAIAIDSMGNAYVAGRTNSNDFPLTSGAIDTEFAFTEAFVAKLNETGSALVYSTFLGGNEFDYAAGIAIDADSNIYVAGQTESSDFPLSHSLQQELKGMNDVFIAKIDAKSAQLVYSTYLGGKSFEFVAGVAVDGDGNAYVAGTTASSDFPTTQGVLQSSFKGLRDVFVVKLNRSGKKLDYSTLLGGTGFDEATGIAINSSGYVYLSGLTFSSDFPTMNPLQDQNKSGSIFKSIDGGNSWQISSRELGNVDFLRLIVDPKTPSTLYANSFSGIFKSTDGGATWKLSLNLPDTEFLPIGEMAIDPVNTLNVYAVLGGGLYKTSDGGVTWKLFNVTPSVLEVSAIFIDPKNPSVIYGGGAVPRPILAIAAGPKTQSAFLPDGLFKSVDGGQTWTSLPVGVPFINWLAIDPVNTSTLYTSSERGILKSTDAGLSWVPKNNGVPNQTPPRDLQAIRSLVVDPQNTNRVYGVAGLNGIIRSTNGGESWNRVASPVNGLGGLVIDPQNPKILYANGFGGFFKSTNRGKDIKVTGLDDIFILNIAVDPVSPSTIYAVAFKTGDLFVAKLNPEGTALAYSTYLGGVNREDPVSIAIDSAGNAYVGGGTISKDFPVTQASFQTSRSNLTDGFIMKIRDQGISTITGVSIKGKKLIVTGKDFDRGAVILVNGIQQKTTNDESNPTTMLIAKKAAKQIARDQDVNIQVRNTDGTSSAPFLFRR